MPALHTKNWKTGPHIGEATTLTWVEMGKLQDFVCLMVIFQALKMAQEKSVAM